DREGEAATAVLLSKPTTEEGAVQLANFAANMADREHYDHVTDACRTLGDWLIARRRARAEG
ncbi:MAG: hypothetical protein JWL93_1887, partial [Hyphomicrobiales bacterium]|nr:hypothetical protein [Hyphomicrobiales bacterium]